MKRDLSHLKLWCHLLVFVCVYVLGFSVHCGCMCRFSGSLCVQVLGDIRGGVWTFQFGLLSLSLPLSFLLFFLLLLWCSCTRFGLGGSDWRRGRGRDLRRVKVHTIGGGVIIPIRPGDCVQELKTHTGKNTLRSRRIKWMRIKSMWIKCWRNRFRWLKDWWIRSMKIISNVSDWVNQMKWIQMNQTQLNQFKYKWIWIK